MTAQNESYILSGWSGLTSSSVSALTGRTLTDGEATLCATLILSFEAWLANQCNRNFVYQSQDSSPVAQQYYMTVDALKGIYFPYNRPVDTVKSILLSGVEVYNSSNQTNVMELGTDFIVYEDRIEVVNQPRYTTDNPDNQLKIYYTIQKFWSEDVTLAVLKRVSEFFLNRESAGNMPTSINVPGMTQSFNSSDVPLYVQSVINQYRLITV